MILILLFVIIIISIINILVVFSFLKKISFITPGNTEAQYTSLEKAIEKSERALRDEFGKSREESGNHSQRTRTELLETLKAFNDSIISNMSRLSNMQKDQLDSFSKQLAHLTQGNEQRMDKMRETIENNLKSLQEDNSKKLEQMRATVDEKLHKTLETRLGESFKLVSERLELVHKGLGEMQTLASGVGDLKKVLTNIKTRGTWGEIQLGNLLEQMLSPEQYAENVATKKGSQERVEYAVKLPGKGQDHKSFVWLPLDSKFPQEDYLKLVDAQEKADQAAVDENTKQLYSRILLEAKTIKEKYIDVPYTTDFGIMFLPSESLYAEVLRMPGLCEKMQREYKIVVTGPTTLAALLNSLQMGFRTLAVEKRSSEVWEILGAVKTEFGKFGEILEKTQKKLLEASNTIDTAAQKSRTIERKLKTVQSFPIGSEEETPVALAENVEN
ncbi:MAG: DNA recombination protein RmuC [Candidatus Margulisbacteria bacterium]|nr:DNA recombination protein RmuC [Candidatus Margulisiibacteriota bacterium]